MAIEGYFRSGFHLLPAPHVQASVFFPRLGKHGYVDFLIDTGADYTSVHPGDIAKLGIDYRYLKRSTLSPSGGIGGSMGYFKEDGLLGFRDSGGGDLRVFSSAINICEKTSSNSVQRLPSILGRDFLNLCVCRIDKSNNEVTLEPLNVQMNLVLPPNVALPAPVQPSNPP